VTTADLGACRTHCGPSRTRLLRTSKQRACQTIAATRGSMVAIVTARGLPPLVMAHYETCRSIMATAGPSLIRLMRTWPMQLIFVALPRCACMVPAVRMVRGAFAASTCGPRSSSSCEAATRCRAAACSHSYLTPLSSAPDVLDLGPAPKASVHELHGAPSEEAVPIRSCAASSPLWLVRRPDASGEQSRRSAP